MDETILTCILRCLLWAPADRTTSLADEKVWTVLMHNNPAAVTVEGSSLHKPHVMTFNYGTSAEQLRAIVSGSEQCHQEVVYNCKRSRLFNTKGRYHFPLNTNPAPSYSLFLGWNWLNSVLFYSFISHKTPDQSVGLTCSSTENVFIVYNDYPQPTTPHKISVWCIVLLLYFTYTPPSIHLQPLHCVCWCSCWNNPQRSFYSTTFIHIQTVVMFSH